MKKVRIYELAKELGVPAKKIISELSKLNIEVKSHMASIDGEIAEKIQVNLNKDKEKIDKSKKIDKSIKTKIQKFFFFIFKFNFRCL